MLIDSETPVNLRRPNKMGSMPCPTDLSTINNEMAATSSNNEVLISQMLNKESALRQSNESPKATLPQQREESEKSIGTMILREAKDEEPSVEQRQTPPRKQSLCDTFDEKVAQATCHRTNGTDSSMETGRYFEEKNLERKEDPLVWWRKKWSSVSSP